MLLIDMAKGKGTIRSAKQEEREARREFRKKRQTVAKTYDSDEEKKFFADLKQLGLLVKIMDGDGKHKYLDALRTLCLRIGNCLFRALSDQIYGNSRQHPVIRAKVVDYIESHKDHYSLFIEDDEPFDDYIKRMRSTGEWGGHPELHAATESLQVNIYVHQVDAPRYILSCSDPTMEIHISYHGDCHYNSVRLIRDPDSGGRPLNINMLELLKEIEASKTKGKQEDISSYWISPEITDLMKLVQDSVDVIGDAVDEVVEMASSLAVQASGGQVEENTLDSTKEGFSRTPLDRSKSVSRRQMARKAFEEKKDQISKDTAGLSKKDARKAAREHTDEPNESLANADTRTTTLGIQI